MKRISNLLISLFLLGSTTTFAHKGHGVVTESPAHYLLSIEHAVPVAVLLFAVIILIAKRKTQKHQG